MRRFIVCILSLGSALAFSAGNLQAQQGATQPRLTTLAVPAAQARSLATKLALRYQDVPGIQISPDVRNQRLVVMAPQDAQVQIAADLRSLMTSSVRQVAAHSTGPARFNLTHVTWREFEDDLQQIAGRPLPVTTSRNGELAAFQFTAAPMQGTTVEVDRRNNTVTVLAPQPT
ncbi:MAG: general secretion pathway protein GspD, partial [Pirellulales bacterium]|nr:general secretion pathway protein GspD [Pirellulales bacterium]